MSDETPTFADVTRDQWRVYLNIQRGGQTNMTDTARVEELSEYELDRDTQYVIRKHYSELAKKFGIGG